MVKPNEKESCAFNEIQSTSPRYSETYPALEQAAAAVWTMVEDSTALLLAECENSHDDVANHIKSMRRSYTSSLKPLRRLREFAATVLDEVKRLERKLEEFQNHIRRTALNYGLNLIPDDVLADIFVLAATTLEEKVGLSLVCKRFRRVMMSMRRMWDGYHINSNQPPEQMIAIAEGSGYTCVKACIHRRSPLGFVEWILSLEPEELELTYFDKQSWEKYGPISAGWNAQNLRSLVIRYTVNIPSMDILKEWNFPHLECLEADFVPATELRNLVRCRLDGIPDSELDNLRNFLANANSLQDLRLFICSERFNEVCNLPSLRSLEVNFIPHPSLAKHLVRFRLDQEVYDIRLPRLPELLDFLSVSTALQKLDVFNYNMCGVATVSITTMPSIVTCVISGRCVSDLIAKLRMPNLRTLKLQQLYSISTETQEEFRTSLQSMTSLEELEFDSSVLHADSLDEIIRFAPHHLESLSLKGCEMFNPFTTDRPRLHTSPAPLRQLIRFTNGCFNYDNAFIPRIVDYLRSIGLDKVKIEFCDCEGWKSGVFGLDDVLSASAK